MAGIEEYLNKIKNAVYGRDVRQAIHDGIHACYEDGKAGAVDLVARKQIAELVAPSGEAPSAAEVTDARIGADGTTYTSLGLANRTQFDKLNSTTLPLGTYFPACHRGNANVSNGNVTYSEGIMNRLVSTEYIDLSVYDVVEGNADSVQAYFMYYDANKNFVSNSGGWVGINNYKLDTTKAYARFMLKNYSGADFDTIPENVIGFANEGEKALSEEVFDSYNRAVYGLWYDGGVNRASLAQTGRWFVPYAMSKGWLSEVKLKAPTANGIVCIELWTVNNGTYTRKSKYEQIVIKNKGCTVPINEAVDSNTYISFYANEQGALRTDNTSSQKLRFLRNDKESTTVSENSLETFSGYTICADILLYSIENADSHNEQLVYTVGENDNVVATIVEAMKNQNSIVVIEPYTHDCIAEWEDYYGSDYFSTFSAGRGLELTNGVHIIGRSGNLLTCHYTGDNDVVMENFSLFNNGGTGYTLENLNIKTSRIRYCVHDERGSNPTPYKVKYSRCRFWQDNSGSTWQNSRACIGGGLGLHGDVTVEDCIFATVTSEENMDSLAYHNSAGAGAQNSLVIKNNYCEGDSTLQLASYGDSTLQSKVIVSSNSFGSPIEELDWGGVGNMDIFYINNEIRS